ncbi:MAG: hypothetical protein OEV85_08240 [Candidatus Thorarchaeota archaeon]|nr:hypothetical protein [Candidatus Thorarchaeota archaeon]
MCETDLESAFAEVLKKACENNNIRGLIQACWVGGPGGTPYNTRHHLTINSTYLHNIYGWWYLVHRTQDGIGAQLIIRFFYTVWLRELNAAGNYQDISAADQEAYFLANGTPGNPAVPDKLIRVEFINFLRSQPNWFESSYGSVAAGDIGPWPTTGSGGD